MAIDRIMPFEAQSSAARAAEVRFRRDLYRFRVLREPVFDDELDGDEIIDVFRQRIADTFADMSAISEIAHVTTALEIGAECCQRAAAVASAYPFRCFAADLSLEALTAIESYAPVLGLTVLPVRVCCDLAVLPFRTGTFDLVFGYQVFHHFERPHLIAAEVRRVNRRVLIVCDEPTARRIPPLAPQRQVMYSLAQRRKPRWRRLVEDLLLQRICNETTYGVVENERLTVDDWRGCFESLYACDWFFGRGIAQRRRLTRAWRWSPGGLWAWLFGTNLSMIGRARDVSASAFADEGYICPDCLQTGRAEMPLQPGPNILCCGYCSATFPIVRDIPILLPTHERRRLYPTL